MAHKLSVETERQSPVFSLHQPLSFRRLYGSLTSSKQSCSLAVGEGFGCAYKAVAAHFEHQRLRKALRGIDERLLDDIGLNRDDIEK